MPDSDPPIGPWADPAAGEDLSALDPLPRTGTSAPAARRRYAESGDTVSTRTSPGPQVDRGPYADDAPSAEDLTDPGQDEGNRGVGQPPPDGRWSGGSAASDAARAARAAGPEGFAAPGAYHPGEPIHRPPSAGTGPGPESGRGRGRGRGEGTGRSRGGPTSRVRASEPVGPELEAAARRSARGALLLAITGVGLTLVFFPVGGALDIAAIVFGVRARRLARRAHTSGTAGGVAIGLGIPAVTVAVLLAVVAGVFFNEARAYVSCTSTAITTTTRDQCTAQLHTDLQRRVDRWSS